LVTYLRAFGHYLLSVQRLYLKTHVALSSLALAYYGLFSLLPLFLLLLGIAGFLLKGRPDVYAVVQAEVQALTLSLFPAAGEFGHQLLTFLTAKALSFTVTSIIFLLWSSSNFFAVLSYALTLIFGGDPYTLKGRIWALLMPFLGGFALIILAILNLISGMIFRYLPFSLPALFSNLISYVLLIGILLFCFRVLPKEPPKLLAALLTSLGIAFSWTLLARLLPLLLPKTSYEMIYGPFAGFALILLGFYFAMWLLLVGAISLQAALQKESSDSVAV
jgi:membrane protein